MKQAKNKKIKILVNGAGGPAGINICRLLRSKDGSFEIFACDMNAYSAGRKFADHFHLVPSADEKIALKWFAKHIKDNKITHFIPTVAETMREMDALQALVKDTDIIVSTSETVELCHFKDRLYSWMDKNFPEYMGKWQKLDKKLTFKESEYIIKPIVGRGSKGVRKVSKKELEFLLGNNKSTLKDYVAMEVLPGREWTVDAYVNKDGSFAYVIPRLRLALAGGISSTGKTDKNEQVIKQTKEVLTKLGCRGPVFIQWKEDKKGKPKMVEINPRASGGLMITALSGGNAADALLSEISGKPMKEKNWKEVTVVRYLEEHLI
jgi:carbamoyl-phosphate synthase large subunit